MFVEHVDSEAKGVETSVTTTNINSPSQDYTNRTINSTNMYKEHYYFYHAFLTIPFIYLETSCETRPGPCINGKCFKDGVGYACACADGWAGRNCNIDISRCFNQTKSNTMFWIDGIYIFKIAENVK